MEIKKSFLLSFPRSGNTFTRYCVEYLTQHPTTSAPTYEYNENKIPEHKDEKSVLWNIGMEDRLKSEKNILVKKHKMYKSEKNKYPMIFVIRNYKEVLIRHYIKTDNAKKNIQITDRCNYAQCLIDYDQWRKDKILIYYEDLITDTQNTIKDIIKFLNQYNEDELQYFMNDIDMHRKNSLKLYDVITNSVNNESRSLTKGKKKLYHSNVLSEEEKKEWDKLMKESCGQEVYNKYLIRYKEI